jgi:hypothetical protein
MYLSDGVSSEGSLVVLQTSRFSKCPKLQSFGNPINKLQVASSHGEIRAVVNALLNDRFPVDFSGTAGFELLAAEARTGFIAL